SRTLLISLETPLIFSVQTEPVKSRSCCSNWICKCKRIVLFKSTCLKTAVRK
ncbi:hypothetical protein M9458_048107, partial [Cirrhinus mrigala]